MVIFLFCIKAYSQNHTDTIVSLHEINVSSSGINYSPGKKSLTLDSASVQANSFASLAELLTSSSSLYIKNYGPGSSSILSIRGGGASQSIVLWNGIKLENPMLALTDISLVPVIFLDKISIEYGNRCVESGSGAIGGLINLQSQMNFDKGVHASFLSQYSSYNDLMYAAVAGLSTKKISTTIKWFEHRADNNYTFTNLAKQGHPLDTLSNSAYYSKGILNENSFRPGASQLVNLRFWYEATDRQIPPSMTESSSNAKQFDESVRLNGDWKFNFNHLVFSAKAAYMNEVLNYSVNHSTDNSHFNTLIGIVELNYVINSYHTLKMGVEEVYNSASEKAFGKDVNINRLSFFEVYSFEIKKLKLVSSLQVREEFTDSRIDPLIASLGFDKQILNNLTLKMSATRNYRRPSLNDLFWTPGGNPALLPESGWSADAEIIHLFSGPGYSNTTSVAVYNRDIQNQISWLPDAAYWSPQNIHAISKGVEFENKFQIKINKFSVSESIGYQYVNSVYGDHALTSKDKSGKQQIYMPNHRISINTDLALNKYLLHITYLFTSFSYTTTDNSSFIDPYQVVNIYLAKAIERKKISVLLHFGLNNLLNESYQVIEYRPMPGRIFNFGIKLNYQSN